jgi:hypothetical protein
LEGKSDEGQSAMSNRKFYKHSVTVVFLAEDSPLDFETLGDINYAITDGPCVGLFPTDESCVEVTGKEAAELLSEFGSEPSFFNLDDEGNDVDD